MVSCYRGKFTSLMFSSEELKIHSENEKEVINAEVNGKEAIQTCVDERVVKQKEFFQPIKISNLKNNS